MPALTETGFLRHIEACNQHKPSRYRPWLIDGDEVGLIRHELAERLARDYSTVFTVTRDKVTLRLKGSFEFRTEALTHTVKDLARHGLCRFRDEPYRVSTSFNATPLAHLDRGAAALFGIRSYGVHVNGIVGTGKHTKLWLGQRSLDRTVDPGKLDQLVAGGLPAGLTAHQTVIKEAHEEAGVKKNLARQAVPVGTISYKMDTEEGLKRDTIFAYDLRLPADLKPHNVDGEVAKFHLLPVGKVAEIIRTTDRFKWNCPLVIIDFLIRHGHLDSTHPEYEALCHGLRAQVDQAIGLPVLRLSPVAPKAPLKIPSPK